MRTPLHAFATQTPSLTAYFDCAISALARARSPRSPRLRNGANPLSSSSRSSSGMTCWAIGPASRPPYASRKAARSMIQAERPAHVDVVERRLGQVQRDPQRLAPWVEPEPSAFGGVGCVPANKQRPEGRLVGVLELARCEPAGRLGGLGALHVVLRVGHEHEAVGVRLTRGGAVGSRVVARIADEYEVRARVATHRPQRGARADRHRTRTFDHVGARRDQVRSVLEPTALEALAHLRWDRRGRRLREPVEEVSDRPGEGEGDRPVRSASRCRRSTGLGPSGRRRTP